MTAVKTSRAKALPLVLLLGVLSACEYCEDWRDDISRCGRAMADGNSVCTGATTYDLCHDGTIEQHDCADGTTCRDTLYRTQIVCEPNDAGPDGGSEGEGEGEDGGSLDGGGEDGNVVIIEGTTGSTSTTDGATATVSDAPPDTIYVGDSGKATVTVQGPDGPWFIDVEVAPSDGSSSPAPTELISAGEVSTTTEGGTTTSTLEAQYICAREGSTKLTITVTDDDGGATRLSKDFVCDKEMGSVVSLIEDDTGDCMQGSEIDPGCQFPYNDLQGTVMEVLSGDDITIDTFGHLLVPMGVEFQASASALNNDVSVAGVSFIADGVSTPMCDVSDTTLGSATCDLAQGDFHVDFLLGDAMACADTISLNFSTYNSAAGKYNTDSQVFPTGKTCDPIAATSGTDLHDATTIYTKPASSGCLNTSDDSPATGCPQGIEALLVYQTGEGPFVMTEDIGAGLEIDLLADPRDIAGATTATVTFTHTDASTTVITASAQDGMMSTCQVDGVDSSICRIDFDLMDFHELQAFFASLGKTPSTVDVRIDFLNGGVAVYDAQPQFNACTFGGWSDILACQ
jgi:hypothetical protein